MIKFNLLIIFALCASSIYPATSSSRWFSSSWQDLSVTLARYSNCVGNLPPLKKNAANETQYLIQQMQTFLDQGTYEADQLQNVSLLMDKICQTDSNADYPISAYLNVSLYNHPVTGKDHRCRSIWMAMDTMYHVFKRATYNKSEPLDFSVIHFYPDPANKANFYNLTDLINTSWIQANVELDHVCKITNAIKNYVRDRIAKTIEKRNQQNTGAFSSIFYYIDLLLDPILGLQKRLYWDSNNRIEMVYYGLGNQLGNLRSVIGRGLNSTKNAITGRFGASTNSSSTIVLTHNGTSSTNSKSSSSSNSAATTTSTTSAPMSEFVLTNMKHPKSANQTV